MARSNRSSRPVPFVRPREESQFAREIPVSSAYLEELARQEEYGVPSVREELLKKQVVIRVPKPGQNWWYGGWFTPPPEELQKSREALQSYRGTYGAEESEYGDLFPFPWRVRRSPATGLPAYLRGWLKQMPTGSEDAKEKAQAWLDEHNLGQALLGQDEWRHFFPKPPETISSHPAVKPSPEEPSPEQEQASADPRFHVTYQQWHQEWPVFGGQLVVHMIQDDRRVSATNSYLPVPPDKTFGPVLGVEDAKHIARRALVHYLPPLDLLSGCLRMLLDLLRQVVSKLLGAPPAADEGEETLLLPEWDVRVRSYAGKEQFVLPFAGEYHLVYEVHLTSPDASQSWSIFVDAETGDVLGRPFSLVFHADACAFASSAEALTGGLPTLTEPLTSNPCHDFMDIRVYTAQGQDRGPVWTSGATTGPDFEATNVAIHARKMYDYLTTEVCDAEQRETLKNAAAARPLRALVATPDTGKLNMGFYPSTRLIKFQHDAGTGLSAEGGIVHHPAHDPEVIYHEVNHGLMWLLKPDPFDHLVGAPPFARSLVEGYANYFARSLAAKGKASPTANWATAAYRLPDWGDRWALFRDKLKPGADLLLLPNVYPYPYADEWDIEVYDVGMIWARALWDLRQLARRQVADALALEAFHRAHGWVTSFEALAEGLLEAALETNVTWYDALLPLFAGRGIVAAQGIQALAAAGQTIVVGADAGLKHSDDGGNTWADEELENVVALAAQAGTLYAATESGVYKRTAQGWIAVGSWPPQQRPLSLAASADGELYVGTGMGVWTANANAASPVWQQWGGSGSRAFDGLAFDLALGRTSSGKERLYVAGFDRLRFRTVTGSWQSVELQDEKSDMVISVATHGTSVFVGTGRAGIWQRALSAGGVTKAQIATPDADLNQAAVLCLAVGGGSPLTLYAGTTKGVFQGVESDDDWSWTHLDGLPEGAAVTALAVVGTRLFAGTALHGLWRWEEGKGWKLVAGVQALSGLTLAEVSDASDAVFTVSAPATGPLCILPFYLTQERKVKTDFGSASVEAELWWLGPNVRQIASSPNGNITTATAQPPGFYAVITREAAAYTVTVSAVA